MLIDRRTFLGLTSAAVLGFSLGQRAGAATVAKARGQDHQEVLPSVCDHDCGGRCLMRVELRGGRVIHIGTDDGERSGRGYGYHAPDHYQLRSCVRGRAYREQVYSPLRLLAPMKRVGPRGAGKFAPVSWAEALQLVARKMRGFRRRYGPASVFCGLGAGTASALNSAFHLQMLLARWGGFTAGWSQPSWEAAHFAQEYTLGLNDEADSGYADGADAGDFLDSKLILMWGWNPAHTHFGTTTKYHLQRASAVGIPIICVDPIYTETAARWGSEWIPIKPGADAAVLMAMAYVMFDEGLVDTDYVARFVDGAEDYRRELLGGAGGTPKDPRWAAAISDVPAATIVDLARRYAGSKPANLVAGYAPGRSAFGEQYHRAALALQALSGNIGRRGGGAAGHRVGWPLAYTTLVHTWWERFQRDIEVHDAQIAMIKTPHFADLVLEGRKLPPGRVGCHKPLPADLHMLYACAWNPLNQLPDLNHTRAALERLDFIVVQDQRLTPTARYADLLLPACTMLEREDFTPTWRDCEPHLQPQAQALAPLGQSRPDHWIFDQLARHLGIKPLRAGRTPRQWLDYLLALDGHAPFAAVVAAGGLRQARPQPWVPFASKLEDPIGHPFQTPSGRIEIASQVLAQMDFEQTSYGRPVPALPSFLEDAEGPGAASPFALQLVTTKAQHRCHSTFTGNPLLEELARQQVLINPIDAARRGIVDGEPVFVWNRRGSIRVLACLSERIKPGVVMVPEGAWYAPDAQGVDRGGNPNLLTSAEASPAGAYAYNSARVEVEPVKPPG